MLANNRPRKACDLCYTRKLRCNMEKPLCSNCVSYGTECTRSAQSRKWKPKAQRSGGATETVASHGSKTLIQTSEAHSPPTQSQDEDPDQDQDAKQPLTTGAPSHERLPDVAVNGDGSLELPPLQECMDMVGIFLNGFNSVLPLFHANTLLRLVGECYAAPPHQRDHVTLAAINVVLALASQHMPANKGIGIGHSRADHTTAHLNKAQAFISQLMFGDLHLLNIQTLVGMVMVLQTAHDVTPALISISATMRLVHKLGLHSRMASAHLDPVERRQRNRVFWLAYILDKSLSLRANQPSVQVDDDIDLELPSSLPINSGEDGDTAGIVFTADGKAKLDYFLARVQLANIEGGVYDCLYSTRAIHRSSGERSMARQSIVAAIVEWRAAIPSEFGAGVVAWSTSNNSATRDFFCVLHSTCLQCITRINQAHAWDEQWVIGLHDGSRGARTLQLPENWHNLVRQARDFMILFSEAYSDDVWFRWMSSCSYITAMGLLIANDLCNIGHLETRRDSQLVDAALLWLNQRILEGQKPDVHKVRDVCVEAVRQVRQKRAEAEAKTYLGRYL